jgi:basic membrane protein A
MRNDKRHRGVLWRMLVVLAALTVFVAACGDDDDAAPETTAAAAETTAAAADAEPCIRVAVLVVRDITDRGWNEAHGNGAAYLEEQLPCAEVLVLTDVADDQTSEAVMHDLADDGYDLIFATSFGYVEFMSRVAPDHPDVIFEHASGYLTDENFSNYSGANYEAHYLAGMTAGLMTEANKMGFVGPFTTPDVLRDFNAFVLGAWEVNPDVEFQMIWVNTWFDPAVETQAAQTLLDAGADILTYGTSGGSVGQAADAAGAYWIPTNGLGVSFAPETFLTGANYDWGVYMVEAAQAVIDGTWDNVPYWGTMADGFIRLSDFGPAVPDDVAAVVRAREAELKAGTFEVFCGPIIDQDGNVQVAEGECAELGHIFGVDYVLQGVEGSLPN